MSVAAIQAIYSNPDLTDEAKAAQIKVIVQEMEAKAKEKGAVEAQTQSQSLMSMFTANSPAAKDPVEVMREVLADERYTPQQKDLLFFMSRERFQNRRKMAYVALTVLVLTAGFMGVGWISDVATQSNVLATCLPGLSALPDNLNDVLTAEERLALIQSAVDKACEPFPFSSVLRENTEILTWLGTFFTSIIALYFGAASFRPTS